MKKLNICVTLIVIIALLATVVLALTVNTDEDEGHRLVDTETVYYIDIVKSSVKNIPLIFLDSELSSLTLRTDGTATLRLQLNELSSLANSFLGDVGNEDISGILGMLYEYLPGLDLTDLSKTLEVFEGGLKIKLLGIDPEDPKMQAMFAYMGEHGTLPPSLTLPDKFGLEITNTYYIKDVTSEHTGVTYTGIYMGNHHKDGEAFLMMEIAKNDDGTAKVIMDYKLIDIYIIMK